MRHFRGHHTASQFKEPVIYGGQRTAGSTAASAPVVAPRIAPVHRVAFSQRPEEGGCADDVAGSAQLLLRDLLMAARVFDDSCKNLRLRVSFTAVKSLSSNLPHSADLWSAPQGRVLSTPLLDTR